MYHIIAYRVLSDERSEIEIDVVECDKDELKDRYQELNERDDVMEIKMSELDFGPVEATGKGYYTDLARDALADTN